MNLLQVISLQKKYQGQHKNAVNGVSFSVEKGEILAVVGENGSGKTTLLRLINGLEDADSGEVIFNNQKITGPASNLVPGHEQIKMLFQEFNLLPKHTIAENIANPLRFFSKEYQEERIKELLKLCRLEGMENKLPDELSGGQQQRVALAKAIADEPLLLLMDEPFSNLDVMLKDEIKKKVIREVKAKKNSAIFVTHDVNDALALADKIAVLKDGNLIQLDTPQNVYEKPVDPYVAYLFGNVNILEKEKFLKVFPIENKKANGSSNKISIRPEHILICKEDKALAKGKIKTISYLGNSFELEVALNGLTIRVNTRKRNLESGQEVFLKVSQTKVNFF